MRVMNRLWARGLSTVAGRVRTQFIFRRMYAVGLVGRNFGPSEVEKSGEPAALERMKAAAPAADVIFDVGANVGEWTIRAAHRWPLARIHAFEPSAKTFATLEAVTAGLRVTCVRRALSDQPGHAELHEVPGLPGLSSLHRRDLSTHGMEMSATEDVDAVTLDQYCADNDIGEIDIVKLDVEGHELAVLHGARRLLEGRHIRFIQFEFGGTNIDSRTYLRDFVDLLGPNFRLYRLLADGVEPLHYSEREEIFVTTNYLAERRDPGSG
jgi:FkbM family methyltransferase